MEGFSLRDSPTFDDWQFYQADSLRRELANALERLVECISAQRDFDTAVVYARRLLALDRLNESAHRLLMQLYAWNNQRAAALHQYRECVQVLEEEVGVPPLETTTRLYQAIKEQQALPQPAQLQAVAVEVNTDASGASVAVAAPPTSAPVQVASPGHPLAHDVSTSYPLVGRTTEWSTLTKVYDSIGADGHLVILEGEAGIGKTRLAEDFLAFERAKGAHVLTAPCYEGETHLAFSPVVTGLRAAIARKEDRRWLEVVPAPWLSEAARLLPELLTLRPGLAPAPPLDSPGAQSRFFEGLRQILFAI